MVTSNLRRKYNHNVFLQFASSSFPQLRVCAHEFLLPGLSQIQLKHRMEIQKQVLEILQGTVFHCLYDCLPLKGGWVVIKVRKDGKSWSWCFSDPSLFMIIMTLFQQSQNKMDYFSYSKEMSKDRENYIHQFLGSNQMPCELLLL